MLENKSRKILKIDKTLPTIKLPGNKLQMFIDWWNEDIRFEKSIPHSFNEGYLVISGLNNNISLSSKETKETISIIAKSMKTTYRYVENKFIEFLDNISNVTIYFKFLDTNKLYLESYDILNTLISKMTIEFGDSKQYEDELLLFKNMNNFDDFLNVINKSLLALLATSLWYISTASTNTKYIYEKSTPQIYKDKNTVKVKVNKIIKNTIYDFNKIRYIKVDTLKTRKRGWTYSHSFQVHGHYRHYKSGKVIFVQSFIKGKDKDFKAQTITLKPKEK